MTNRAISKPRKLHRQVEQKRRMRISEQISQLKQCVSDPSDVKTDKVSILKRSVAFVKECQTRIHCLQRNLTWLQNEHARLLTLVAGVDPNILRSFQSGAGCVCSACHSGGGGGAGGVGGGHDTRCRVQFEGAVGYRNGSTARSGASTGWNALNCCEANLSQVGSVPRVPAVHAASQSHAHVVQGVVPHFHHVAQHHQRVSVASVASHHAHIAPYPVAHVEVRGMDSHLYTAPKREK